MSKVIGVFACSTALKEGEAEKLEQSTKFLEDHGYRVALAENIFKREEIFPGADYFTAGSLEERLQSFLKLYTDKKINILLALRGGYGAIHLLKHLPFLKMTDSIKPVFGYSDLTSLITAINTYTHQHRLPCFHSPMMVELAGLNHREQTSLLKCFELVSESFFTPHSFQFSYKKYFDDLNLIAQYPQLKESLAYISNNKVFGGNLSNLCSLDNKLLQVQDGKNILFIEECHEEAYRTERLLYQLENQGLLKNIRELWLGTALNTTYHEALIDELAQKNNFTVLKNLPFGHNNKITLPVF